MTDRARGWRAGAALAGFVVAMMAATAAVVWLDLEAAERATLMGLFPSQRVALVLLFSITLVGGLVAIARRWHHRMVDPARRLAEATQLIASSNPEHRVAAEGDEALRHIALAVNALAERRAALARDVHETIRAAKEEVEAEKNRLAALMSELAQSVVVCNAEGRMLLYNAAAQSILGGDDAIGLGRSVFAILDRNVVQHALGAMARKLQRAEATVVQFVATTRGGRLLRVQAAPVLSASQDGARTIAGYVLLMADVTAAVEDEGRRAMLVQTFLEETRSALGNIRAAIETVIEHPGMDGARRDRFTSMIRDEALRLSGRLDTAGAQITEQFEARWPLEDMRGEDLITLARERIEQRVGVRTAMESIDPEVWVKVDSFAVAQGLAYLAARLKEEFAIGDVRFRLTRGKRHAHLDLVWRGAPLSFATAFQWENDPFYAAGETSALTWKQVAERHGAEAWYRRDLPLQSAYFRLLLPLAAGGADAAALVDNSRGEYYDFDLFRPSAANTALDDRPLGELAYTAFDTETTGLDPSQGDEIVAIGAVRIVNGRLLRSEIFEQLVDPRRPLSAASMAIHGITPDQLKGQPTIDAVLPRLHRFVEDTVLVGHNAAFDMRFLQLKEAQSGCVFDQPVLDTLLLSAVIHPHQTAHSLESIAARLGVATTGRHSALGDAIMTGQVFLRMIPLLTEAGIRTLGEARTAAQKTLYARLSY